MKRIYSLFLAATSIANIYALNIRPEDIDDGYNLEITPLGIVSLFVFVAVLFALIQIMRFIRNKYAEKCVYVLRPSTIAATTIKQLKTAYKTYDEDNRKSMEEIGEEIMYSGENGIYSISNGCEFIVVSKGLIYSKIRGSVEISGYFYGYQWLELYVRNSDLIKTDKIIKNEKEIFHIYSNPGYEDYIPKQFK